MSTTVTSVVEQQSATPREIAGNVAQASQGIQEVTENISQAATVTSEIATEIADVNIAVTELSQSSTQGAEQLEWIKRSLLKSRKPGEFL